MSTVVKDLGAATAYGYAVEKGYTGTEAEFAELMADYATVGQTAVTAAQTATTKASEAATSATTATTKASEATTAATTATNKAAEAQADADAAALDASQALSAASTATSKATEATTAAATAVSAKDDAVSANTAAQSAKTAAQTAQTGAETAAASVQSSAAQIQTNADDISELKEDFATMESDGVVPSAEQILTDKGVTDSVPYHYRRTGGNGADRLYDQIVGGTVCWNQLCNGSSVTVTSGHKYVSKVSTTWTVGASTGSAITGLTSGSDMVIDLTAMFGSTIADHIYSLEQATAGAGVALFKSLFPKDYYAYDSGSMQSVSGMSEHRTVGFNQFDKDTAVVYSRYLQSSSGNYYWAYDEDSKSIAVRCLPNTQYCAYANGLTPAILRCGSITDAEIPTVESRDLVRLEKMFVNSTTGMTIYTTGANAKWLIVQISSLMFNDVKNNLCINIYDEPKNGTYEPYSAHSYALDDSLTLRGIPTLVDGKIKWDGDIYASDGSVTRRYGIVDLGTLDWAYVTTSDRNYFRTVAFTIRKVNTPVICSKYVYCENVYDSAMATAQTGIYTAINSSHVQIKDTSYTDAATFKTAMSGVYLVYELATPTTESADPYQHLQQCDPYGTEEYVSTGIVPIGHNSFYPENLREKIEQLPWNFASLIAPTESTFTATRNYTTGALFIVDNVLYKATSNIANGGTITPNTNCTATTLAEIISALA